MPRMNCFRHLRECTNGACVVHGISRGALGCSSTPGKSAAVWRQFFGYYRLGGALVLVDDFEDSFGVALKDLGGTAEGHVKTYALARGEAARHGEVEGIGSDGQVVTQELHVNRAKFGGNGRSRAEEFARTAHQHQAGRFAATGVGGENSGGGGV